MILSFLISEIEASRFKIGAFQLMKGGAPPGSSNARHILQKPNIMSTSAGKLYESGTTVKTACHIQQRVQRHSKEVIDDTESVCPRQPAVSPLVSVSRKIEFERIAMVHAEHLRRFAIRVSSDHSHAEDLTQETLLSAWSNFHQFQHGTNCRAWLFKILVNLRNKGFRKCGTPAESLSIEQQTIDVAVPENISNSTEVRVAFERLSPEHRDILRLGMVEGFSVRALAARLKIPPGTVMSRLSRARAKLRTALGRPDMAQALS